MEYGYSFIMFIFAGCILVYGLVLIATKNYDLVARNYVTSPEDKERYAKAVGKILCVCALPPAVSAYMALLGEKYMAAALVSLVIGFIVCIDFGIKRWPNEIETPTVEEDGADEE